MDNQRLILLLVFSFSVIMLWESWQKQEHPQALKTPTSASQSAATHDPVPTPLSSLSTSAAVPAVTATQAAAAQAPRQIIKTDLYTAEISAQGGDLTRLELVRHHATEDKNKTFVLFDNGEKHLYQAQSGLMGEGLPTHKTLYTFEPGSEILQEGQDSLVVRLHAPDANGVSVSKRYTFHRGSYLIDVAYEISNKGTATLVPSAYYHILRDGKPPEGSTGGAFGVHVFTGPAVYTEHDKYQKVSFEEIAKGKAHFAQKADNGWIAMVQHYFVSAWLPQGQQEREFYMEKLGDDLYRAGFKMPLASIAPGGSVSVGVPLYAGPQEQDKLAKIAPGLDLVVDYGWLTVIAAPLFWVLELLHKWVGNWGWAIIALTVLLKLIFYPLSATSYKSMAKMKVVAPKLTKLKETYGDDRARLNQEMMELYKREKINPLSGCLPVLVQIPVFIALYWVLLGSVEMRYAPFIGYIQDLSAKDPYFVLPIIMGLTMIFQMRLNPAPPDPIQAKVMMFMPIVFTGMFLFFPSGLVLYWIVNNVLSIAQQWQINRVIEAGGTKAA
ncbi:MAG: membrane protein insertase YidC [Sterolibacterium sp.]|jgi:YidC/Oxa1 family membrane protein insertase|nr:membrane protein insertase YidC [Sterolibacterium sp.]